MNWQPTDTLTDPDDRTGTQAGVAAAQAKVSGEAAAPTKASGEAAAPTGDTPARMRWSIVDGAAIAFFVAIAYRITSAMWTSPTRVTPSANGTDQAFFEWMLLHAVRIFTHGENPFLTTQLNAPIGVNVMANTGLLGLTIPLAPLTAWLGPAPVYVLIIMLGLAGTATAWYYVLSRHFVGHRFAAVVGAVICGFGPGIVTHANGHPNLCAQFLLPLILWRALALRNSTRFLRDGAILGGLIAYQAFLNEELLFLTALAGTLFVLLYIPFRRDNVRAWAAPTAKGLGVAALVSGVVLAYPLWYQFNGQAHFAGLPAWMQDSYRLTLASFVHTPTLSLTGNLEANQWLATRTEENSFLGWALLITAVAAVIVAALRRRLWAIPLGLVGLLFGWASFGNKVYVTTGPQGPRHEVPVSLWSHLNTLPIFESVLPSRLALVVLPVAGILVALLTAEITGMMGRALDREEPIMLVGGIFAALTVILVVASVFPKPVPVDGRSAVPVFFTSGDYKRYVPKGTTVLAGDPSDTIGSMRWAITSDLWFGVPGGYFLGPDEKNKGQYGPQFRQTMVLLWDVAKDTWQLNGDIDYWKATVARDLGFWNTSTIVLPVNTERFTALQSTITQLVGGTGHQVDDVWVWDVRSVRVAADN